MGFGVMWKHGACTASTGWIGTLRTEVTGVKHTKNEKMGKLVVLLTRF